MLSSIFGRYTKLSNGLYQNFLFVNLRRTCHTNIFYYSSCNKYVMHYNKQGYCYMSTASAKITAPLEPNDTSTTAAETTTTTTTKKQQHLYMWGLDRYGTILNPSILENTTNTATTTTTTTTTATMNGTTGTTTSSSLSTLPTTPTTTTTTTTTDKNFNIPTLITTLPNSSFLSNHNEFDTNDSTTATISKVICGPTETAIILSNGLCYVSGRNAYGQLGNDKKNITTPICINPIFPYYDTDNENHHPTIIRDVALGTNFAAYLVEPPPNDITSSSSSSLSPSSNSCSTSPSIDGYDLYTCGFGGSTMSGVGCLGHGNIQHRTTPTLVESLYEDNVYVQQVVAGDAHCTILTTESEILTTGSGSYGRLGNFDTTDQLYFEPVEIELNPLVTVAGGNTDIKKNHIVQIAGGKSFTLALSYDGIMYGWGRNHKGQLGTGLGLAVDMYAMQSVPEPIDTSDLVNRKVIQIAAGHSHAACITEHGELYYWGMSLHLEPVLVSSLLHTKIVNVVCGQDYTLAIDINGHMYSFGSGMNVLGHGKDIKHLNEPTMLDTIHTGIIETKDDNNTSATSKQRKVMYASAGWQHAACLVVEEDCSI
jgi:alpha-tubulin suppressor-like RCC1 family protein